MGLKDINNEIPEATLENGEDTVSRLQHQVLFFLLQREGKFLGNCSISQLIRTSVNSCSGGETGVEDLLGFSW